MNFFESIKRWLFPAPALSHMRLGPDDSQDNPLMVGLLVPQNLAEPPLKIQFFTWNSHHPDMSWWQHFESELPRLSELGFTQVWLPPPNKAAWKVRISGSLAFCFFLTRVGREGIRCV